MKIMFLKIAVGAVACGAWVACAYSAQAAEISCTFTTSSTGTCSLITPLPSNCTSFREEANPTMRCDGYPEGFRCNDTTGASTFRCNNTPACQAVTPSSPSVTKEWICPSTDPEPSNCEILLGSTGEMRCQQPAGYTCTPTLNSLNCVANPPPPQTNGQTSTPSNNTSNNGNLTYVPLEPLPGVDQSGEANFVELVEGFFRILITVGAFMAVVVLVIGGVTYMFAEQSPANKAAAKDRIRAGLIGLGILAVSYLILFTINPQLVMFNEDFLSPIGGGSVTSPAAQSATYRSHAASSAVGQQYAQRYPNSGDLRDTPNFGALMFVNYADRNMHSVRNAYREMHAECSASGGSLHMTRTAETETYAYICFAQ